MAWRFVCGAECGVLAAGSTASPTAKHWSAVVGATTLETTTVRTGSRSYKFNPSAAQAYLAHDISGSPVRMSARAYIRFSVLPNTTCTLLNAKIGVNYPGVYYNNSTGKITTGNSATYGAGGVTAATGQWYCVEFIVDCSANPWTIDVKVDGVLDTRQTVSNAASTMSSMSVGFINFTTTATLFVDDISVQDVNTLWIGPGEVQGLFPNADGTHSFTANDFIYNAAGGSIPVSATNVNTYIDDLLDNTTDFINQALTNANGYVEVQFPDLPSNVVKVNGVEVVSTHHSAATQSNNCKMKLFDGTNVQDIWSADFSETSIVYSSVTANMAPSAAGTYIPWTKSAVDSISARWGYSSDANPDVYLNSLCLEVDCQTAAQYPALIGRCLSDYMVYVESAGKPGPFQDANGNLYVLVGDEPTPADASLTILKSTDGGINWSRMDEANNPVNIDTESNQIVQDGSTLHILHQKSSRELYYHSFVTSDAGVGNSPDTWRVRDEFMYTPTSALEPTDQQCSLVKRSDELVAIFRGANEVSTANGRIYYMNKPLPKDEEPEYRGDVDWIVGWPTIEVGVGQSFIGWNGTLTHAQFYLKDGAGAPTGNAYAKVYASTGVHGNGAKPTGAAIATSNAFDVTAVTGTYDWHTFTFASPPTLTEGVVYIITCEFSQDGSNYLYAKANTSGTMEHQGNACATTDGSTWTSNDNDLVFRIYSTSLTIAWQTPIAVDHGGAVSYTGCTAVCGMGDKVHFFYFETTNNDLYHRSLNKAGSLSSQQIVNDNTVRTSSAIDMPMVSQPVYYNIDGTERITMAWWRESTRYLVGAVLDNDGTWGAETAISTAAVLQPDDYSMDGHNIGAQLVVDPASYRVYAFWFDNTTRNLYYSYQEKAGSWQTPVALETGRAGTWFDGLNVYVKSDGKRYIGMFWSEGDVYNVDESLWFDEFELAQEWPGIREKKKMLGQALKRSKYY